MPCDTDVLYGVDHLLHLQLLCYEDLVLSQVQQFDLNDVLVETLLWHCHIYLLAQVIVSSGGLMPLVRTVP